MRRVNEISEQKNPILKKRNKSSLSKTIDINDLPAQYLGRTAGNLNGYDTQKNVSELNKYLQARIAKPGMRTSNVFNTAKGRMSNIVGKGGKTMVPPISPGIDANSSHTTKSNNDVTSRLSRMSTDKRE